MQMVQTMAESNSPKKVTLAKLKFLRGHAAPTRDRGETQSPPDASKDQWSSRSSFSESLQR